MNNAKRKHFQVFILILCLIPGVVLSENLKLPDQILPDLDGKKHTLREWTNKPVLINFWATWCTPCRKEMPDLALWQSEFSDQNLQIIGIAIDEADSVKQFLKTVPVNYPILLAPDTGTQLSFTLGNQMGVLPFSVFVDPDGTVTSTHIGILHRDMLKQWFVELTHKPE
ncbi:MAG: TlpA family protein disulfide reductase [Gammaproteobacteria bacterium]|nr:TlpA family protein disulfide reductase [Gammaproteobacteria bacterium]